MKTACAVDCVVPRILFFLALALGLAACGGGSDGGGADVSSAAVHDPAPATPQADPESGTAAPTAAGPVVGGAKIQTPVAPAENPTPASPITGEPQPAAESLGVIPVVMPDPEPPVQTGETFLPETLPVVVDTGGSVTPEPEPSWPAAVPSEEPPVQSPPEPELEEVEPGPPLSRLGTGIGVATLSWTPPVQRTDGSALLALGGYRIMLGNDPGSLTEVLEIRTPGIHRYLVEGLPSGLWYFGVMAVDDDGRASELSALVTKLIQ